MTIEVMKQALEALIDFDYDKRLEAIKALRQATKQAEQAEQMELPEPRLTGTFSIRADKFKCTGCTGSWTNRKDAKHHSCKDYQ